jgi:hypothetical protein
MPQLNESVFMSAVHRAALHQRGPEKGLRLQIPSYRIAAMVSVYIVERLAV